MGHTHGKGVEHAGSKAFVEARNSLFLEDFEEQSPDGELCFRTILFPFTARRRLDPRLYTVPSRVNDIIRSFSNASSKRTCLMGKPHYIPSIIISKFQRHGHEPMMNARITEDTTESASKCCTKRSESLYRFRWCNHG